jgi:uncharacterized protein YbjT (DUF2867 family)
MPSRDVLAAMLRGVDAVINAVGIFDEDGTQTFASLHVNGPIELAHAAMGAGVRSFIQISALGADPASPFPYLASKGRADSLLGALPLKVCIVRPSLVFSARGQSTRMFARLAALPLTPVPDGGKQLIQPIHLDDLVDAMVQLVESPGEGGVFNAVGPAPVSFRHYLRLFKKGLGVAGGFISVPSAPLRLLLRLTEGIPGPRMANSDALAMLEAGNVGDSGPISVLLGKAPRAPQTYVPQQIAAIRAGATLPWLVGLLRSALAAMWLATAWISLFAYPVVDSLLMLQKVGLTGPLALAALYGGAGADALLGLATVFARRRHGLYLLQILLILSYTAIISICLPEQWLHPFGPVLKNIPILAMIVALFYLDRDHGPRDH